VGAPVWSGNVLASVWRWDGCRAAAGAIALLGIGVGGCFYDSSWGARKTAEVHNAARATPATLTSAPAAEGSPAAPAGAAITLHIRVHATAAYAAQTPDWPSHVRVLVADASEVLRASAGATLVVDGAESWSAPAHPHLGGDLAALRDEDTGSGADLVIGFVGGLPITTPTFEQAGLALLGGKYLVVRAPNPADEYAAVEKAFDELSEEARARLRHDRLHHREVAVLLHEIGHALGAEHQRTEGSLMRPAYDPKMAAFDDVSLASMRAGLARRTTEAGAAPTLAAAVPANPTSASSAGPPPSVPSPAPASPAPPTPPASPAPPAEIREGDREAWSRATKLAQAGDAEGAWAAAAPLFGAYPSAYAVQDLRCKLAMARSATYDQARAECEPLMKIAMKGAKSK
jgi:hypothetical protein